MPIGPSPLTRKEIIHAACRHQSQVHHVIVRRKADGTTFTVTSIHVDGMPDMDLSKFIPTEIETIKKYAVEEVYPRMLGIEN